MKDNIQHIKDKVIVKHFKRYLENIKLWQHTNIKDPRKKKGKIPILKFIQHMVVGLISGKDSKRALERNGDRKVIEDQTIENILKRIDPIEMSNLLSSTSKAIISFSRRCFGVVPQRGRIDGTVMGKIYITCCSTNLKGYEIILSAMMCEGRGKELEGAKEVVEKVDREFEWLEWYEVDGLYYAKTFIRKSRKKVLIKSKEKTLEVFKKLEWYITLLDKFPDIGCGRCRVVEGYDRKRGRSYRIVVIDGIEDENLGMEVEVGKVVDRWGDEEEEYYILSTQTGVEPEALREMAIERWSIEISFRELNQIMNTKRLRSHNPTSAFNFAILQIIAMNLLLSFFLYLQLCKSVSHTINELPLSRKARYVFERVSVFYYLLSPFT